MIGGMRRSRISRKLKQPTSHADGQRHQQARPGSSSPGVSMTFVATAPASVIVAGIDRSTLPGPERDHEHLAEADDHVEGGEGEGRGQHLAGALAAGEEAGGEPDAGPRRARPRATAWRGRRVMRACPLRSISTRKRQHDDQDRALRADLPVGRDAQEGEERAGQRQGHGADDGADRRDPPADELAAAQDDAGDREQRVAQRRYWRRPRW